MSNLRIEVKSTETDTFSGNAKASGKPFSMTKQVGWFHNPKEPYPTKIELVLKDATKPYAVGLYKLDTDTSIYIDRNGRLAISPVLIAVPADTRKAT